MNHLLDPFNYLFGYDLGNPIEDGKKAQMLNSNKCSENVQKINRKVLYGRSSKEFGSIEGEFTIIEIDGKKLLKDF